MLLRRTWRQWRRGAGCVKQAKYRYADSRTQRVREGGRMASRCWRRLPCASLGVTGEFTSTKREEKIFRSSGAHPNASFPRRAAYAPRIQAITNESCTVLTPMLKSAVSSLDCTDFGVVIGCEDGRVAWKLGHRAKFTRVGNSFVKVGSVVKSATADFNDSRSRQQLNIPRSTCSNVTSIPVPGVCVGRITDWNGELLACVRTPERVLLTSAQCLHKPAHATTTPDANRDPHCVEPRDQT